jgi:hypothetical protein
LHTTDKNAPLAQLTKAPHRNFLRSDHRYDGHAENFEWLTDICLDEEMVNVETLLGRAQELRSSGCTVTLKGGPSSAHGGGHRRRNQIVIGVKNAGKCGTIAKLQSRLVDVNKACCPNKMACPKGVPASCDLECAIVFDPFFRECRSIILGNDEKMAHTLHKVAEKCVKQDTRFIVRAIGAAQCPAGVGPSIFGGKHASLTKACVTASSFIVVGSTSLHNKAGTHMKFELSEVKLFNKLGQNIAKQATVQLLLPPTNPQDLQHVVSGKLWKKDAGSKMLKWTSPTTAGAPLLRLTFPKPVQAIGAELYSRSAQL